MFSGLALNKYRVRQDLRDVRTQQTAPPRREAHVVELTRFNSSVPGKHFGMQITTPARTNEDNKGTTSTPPPIPPTPPREEPPKGSSTAPRNEGENTPPPPQE
jgi:hypothetical protein